MRTLLPFFRTRPISATKPLSNAVACFLATPSRPLARYFNVTIGGSAPDINVAWLPPLSVCRGAKRKLVFEMPASGFARFRSLMGQWTATRCERYRRFRVSAFSTCSGGT
jgi:hypothetical protein